jgi:hypothetical protein
MNGRLRFGLMCSLCDSYVDFFELVPVRKRCKTKGRNTNMAYPISIRLEKVLLQPLFASYSGFSLPLHSPLCLVSEKPDYFANRGFATHPNASFGLKLNHVAMAMRFRFASSRLVLLAFGSFQRVIEVPIIGIAQWSNRIRYMPFSVRSAKNLEAPP